MKNELTTSNAMTIADAREQLKIYQKRVEDLIKLVDGIEIFDAESGQNAMEIANRSICLAEKIEDTKKTLIEPAKEFIKQISSLSSEFIENLDSIKSCVAKKIDDFKKAGGTDIKSENILSYEKTTVEVNVDNFDLVPREFLIVDEVSLKKMYQVGRRVVPGVSFSETAKTFLRRR